MVNGGRLVVQEAYSELFSDIGAGVQGQTLLCHGVGTRAGEVAIDLYSNAASADVSADGMVTRLVGWKGRVTQLTNSYVVGHTRIEGPADGTSLLTLASNWPQVDALPAGAKVLQTNMDFATVNQGVSDTAAFIREGLALRRAAKPTPQPLAAVPAGASDIQFRRLLIWGGTEDGIRIIGASAATAAAPAILSHPADLTVALGQTATFTVAVTGTPSPTLRWQRRSGPSAAWADIGGATANTYAFTASLGDDGAQFRAIATNAGGSATSNPATLTVTTALVPAAIVSIPVTAGTAGQLYTSTIIASGAPAPTLTISGNPAWLNLVAGVLRGTPPAAGTYGPITITADNGVGSPAVQTFSLIVAAGSSGTTDSGGSGGGGCGAGSALGCLLLGLLALSWQQRSRRLD